MRFRVLFALVVSAATACSTSDGRELPPTDSGATTTAGPVATPVASSAITDATPVAPATRPAFDVDITLTTIVPDISASSDSAPATPATTDPDVEPVGFATVAATVTTASGEDCELCLWVASTPSQRSRGLMGVTDLGVGDGMLFRYDVATSTSFWMKDTPLPLSIAFFDRDGLYVDSFDMEPCAAGPCPRHPTPRGFLDAIEFPRGALDELGIGAGSVLAVGEVACG